MYPVDSGGFVANNRWSRASTSREKRVAGQRPRRGDGGPHGPFSGRWAGDAFFRPAEN